MLLKLNSLSRRLAESDFPLRLLVFRILSLKFLIQIRPLGKYGYRSVCLEMADPDLELDPDRQNEDSDPNVFDVVLIRRRKMMVVVDLFFPACTNISVSYPYLERIRLFVVWEDLQP